MQVNRIKSQIEDHVSKGGPPVKEEQIVLSGVMKNFSRSSNINSSVAVNGMGVSVSGSGSGNGGNGIATSSNKNYATTYG